MKAAATDSRHSSRSYPRTEHKPRRKVHVYLHTHRQLDYNPVVIRNRNDATETKPSRRGSPHWVQVGGGQLAVWHRPKLKSMAVLRTEGETHLLTLLSEREGAEAIGAAAKRAGLVWHWSPLDNANPPPDTRDQEITDMLREMNATLDRGGSVLIHCSAGIHRTGMIANALLRLRGLSPPEALSLLSELRQETGQGVGDVRLQWAERLLSEHQLLR